MMTSTDLIAATIAFVKGTLDGAEGGHDWFHTQRVYNNALRIAKSEDVDMEVVQLGALLHDIADAKFYDGDETVGPRMAVSFLQSQGVAPNTIAHVAQIIAHISFKNSLDANGSQPFTSAELQVVRDADRLDAIGAIGIARAFNYGGFKNRKLYDPEVAPDLNMDKTAYKNSDSPTINHFYEKLLLLKEKMHTETAKHLAEERHAFMIRYLDQFYAEWEGKR